MDNLIKAYEPITLRLMNKPVFILGMEGVQLLVVIGALPLSFYISKYVGFIVAAVLVYVLKKIIEENRKGNYNYFQKQFKYKEYNLKDNFGYIKHLVKKELE